MLCIEADASVLACGELQARLLGVPMRGLRVSIYVAATLLTGAALAGGALLVVTDLLARTIVAPRQLPVDALTALIVVPLFLHVMRRQVAR